MKDTIWIGVKVASALFLIWFAWGGLHLGLAYFGFRDISKLGQWGDTFGALNALFGAFGFAAVVATLWLQQQQNISTAVDQHKQRFDSSYFEILSLLREVRNEALFSETGRPNIDDDGILSTPIRTYRGSEAFREAWFAISTELSGKSQAPDRAEAGRIYNDVIQKKFETQFSPYFRLIYTILDRLRNDIIITEDEKLDYARLLRSQMTSDELALAAVNGLSPISKDFSQLLTAFRMLKYIPPGVRLRTLKRYYVEEAFSSRD